MDVSEILLHILVVLFAAKLAAELADRVGIPPVVAEIAAGILIGPSVFGFVAGDEVLRILGELGVILLLLEVGLEMDIGELGAVGGAALRVASLGVIAPFASGTLVGIALGMDTQEAIFVGAALTATSVGITARVFGDMRALATVEARTVLGAAVADDVMGLVILTVVTRLVTEGSVSPLGVTWLVVVAIGFLVISTAVGVKIVPPLFALVARYSRSAGTLVAVAFAFTLSVAELANAVKLAPIVGAFVAGLALSRSPVAPRVRRELAPVGHLFVPVFFLMIGIDADVKEFADGKVLGLAAALLAVAIAGKIVAGWAVRPGPGDKLLIGFGMLPRGEVGLIFAALGLREAVFGRDVYAALLLVVLVTTMLAPPLLRWQSERVRARARTAHPEPQEGVQGGLTVVDGQVQLTAEPAAEHALALVLDAARLCATHAAAPSLLDWIADYPAPARRFDGAARERFFALLHEATPRSWRLLVMSGVLDRALPELAAALGARGHGHAFDVDPLAAFVTSRLETAREDAELAALADPDPVLLAALVLDACDGTDHDPATVGRRTAQRLGLPAPATEHVAGLLADVDLLFAAARRGDAFEPESVLQLAAHVASTDAAHALHVLSRSGGDGPSHGEDRATLLYHALLHAIAAGAPHEHDGDGDGDGGGAGVSRGAGEVERRRTEARSFTADPDVRERIDAAPREYVLQVSPCDLARQAELCEPAPQRDDVRVAVHASATGGPGANGGGRGRRSWTVEIASRDRVGTMARVTRAFAELDLPIVGAVAATYGDGTVIESYRVLAWQEPDAGVLVERLRQLRRQPLYALPVDDAEVEFDDVGSPWSTRCTVQASDRTGLLQALTTAIARGGASVRAAKITTEGAAALDTFDLTTRDGRKLDARTKARIVDAPAVRRVRRRSSGSRSPVR